MIAARAVAGMGGGIAVAARDPAPQLTDRGLVDVDAFAFTDVFVDGLPQQAG